MKKVLLFSATMLAISGCSSVKTVGDGMVVGSAAGGIYATPITVVGAALSRGADLFSPGGPFPRDDRMDVDVSSQEDKGPYGN